MEKRFNGVAVAGLVIAIVAAVIAIAVAIAPAEEDPIARSYGCAVYTEQGCAKYVVATGGEIEIQSGGTLDVQSGATSTYGGAVDIGGTLQYGASDLYPVGYVSSGQQAVYGTASITGTLVAPHGLTTVTFCLATLGEDPTSGGGDAAHVSVAVSANVCTLKAWQDDFVTAATEADVAIHWLVIGAP